MIIYPLNSVFSNFFSNTVHIKTLLNAKISLRVFLLLLHIRRIQGKCLSVYGEYGEFMVLCVTQNRFRIRGKNLCVHAEDAKRHIIVKIFVNNHTNFNFLKILSMYLHMGWIRPKNHPTLLSL